MGRPKGEGDVRQVIAWLPADLKKELEERAAQKQQSERKVLTDALEAHLRGAPDKQSRRR